MDPAMFTGRKAWVDPGTTQCGGRPMNFTTDQQSNVYANSIRHSRRIEQKHAGWSLVIHANLGISRLTDSARVLDGNEGTSLAVEPTLRSGGRIVATQVLPIA